MSIPASRSDAGAMRAPRPGLEVPHFDLRKGGRGPKKGKRVKLKKLTRDFLKGLDTALPATAGQGGYWRNIVINGSGDYPPLPTTQLPRECRRLGDRGRLYPSYYVVELTPPGRLPPAGLEAAPAQAAKGRSRSCCLDCQNNLILRREVDWAIFAGYLIRDGIAIDEQAAAGADPSAPADSRSPSAIAFEELRAQGLAAPPGRGPRLEEAALPTEDPRVLAEQIRRFESGDQTALIEP